MEPEIHDLLVRLINNEISEKRAVEIIEEKATWDFAFKKFNSFLEKLCAEENAGKAHVLVLYSRLYKTNLK